MNEAIKSRFGGRLGRKDLPCLFPPYTYLVLRRRRRTTRWRADITRTTRESDDCLLPGPMSPASIDDGYGVEDLLNDCRYERNITIMPIAEHVYAPESKFIKEQG